VPTALPIPPDLIELHRTTLAATATLGDYINEVEQRRRQQYPDPEQLAERRAWSKEENAELTRLREIRNEAAKTCRRHPTIVQALEERCWPQTWDALQDACRAKA
jgi:hypothetical protein